MNHRVTGPLGTALAISLFSASGAAQSLDPQCTAQPTATQDACQKAVDFFHYVAPSFGTVITGGNATLGQVGAIGKTGHFSFELRVVGMQTDLPRVDSLNISTSGPQRSTYTTKQQWIGFPTADVAVGLFRGLSVGAGRLGAVDALVNLAYIPEINAGDYHIVTPNGSFKAGFGARIGVIAEGPLVPAVAFTVLRRDLPSVGLSGSGLTTSQNDSVYIDTLSLRTTSWRVTVGKHAGILGVVVGMGRDHYSSSADLHAVVAPRPPATTSSSSTGTLAISQSLDRTNVFADLNLFILHAEVGHVSGGTIPTYNTFTGGADPSKGRTYFATGVRLGI